MSATSAQWESERLQTAFGAAIRKGRVKAGLSVDDLAAELGVDKRTLYRWEAGKHRHFPWAALYLCKRFNIDIRRLA